MDALDPEISDFAARNGWVVFTEDDGRFASDDRPSNRRDGTKGTFERVPFLVQASSR